MTDQPRLSPKLHLTAEHGFTVHHSTQPDFRREWHRHDCGMLLWPRLGGLKSAWGTGLEMRDGTQSVRLVRGTAVLLPAHSAHITVADTGRQQHGELYLPPESLRDVRRFGALRLDTATVAMLDALLAPMIATASASHLVRAIVAQMLASPSLPLATEPESIALRMAHRFTHALEWEVALPSIDSVAAELGVSIRQLQRACQQEFGTSPVDIRRRLLAAHARELLAEGRPLTQVSERLGFANSGHLARLLRATATGSHPAGDVT